jgi:hypothetical protein
MTHGQASCGGDSGNRSRSLQNGSALHAPHSISREIVYTPLLPTRWRSAEESEAMTATDFRRIALSLPETVEGSHFGSADFRVGGKIFATLALESEGYGVLLLAPDEQAGMVEDAPEIFSPVPGGWGRKGSTRVRLSKVTPDILEAALRSAWRRKAPKRLWQTGKQYGC